jgi:16S rRNA (guanine527-N7)-methyltransferase
MISTSQWNEIRSFLQETGDPLELASSSGLREALSQYLDLLLAKNEEVNLTAIRDPETAVWKHITDSLALLQWEDLGTVVDWGSGGGLPGIPLLLARREAGITTPVHFLDSVGKKIRAIEGFCQALGLSDSKFFLGRGEDLIQRRELSGVDTVVMRAVAPAERAVKWIHPSLARWVLLLGPQQLDQWKAEERAVDRKGFRFARQSHFSLPQGQGQRSLLELLKK